MRRIILASILVLGLSCLFAGGTKADTISVGGVSYTVDGLPGSNVVTLIIDTSGAPAGTTLSTFSLSGVRGITLAQAPAGWSYAGQGPSNSSGCNINGSAGHFCFSDPGGSGGVLTFVFNLTGTAPGQIDIQAFQGTPLAISQGVHVPEPASLTLLGAGLFALGGLFLRRKA